MSTRIDISFTDERLLRDNKRRTAANQQALDDRTQSAKEQQAAEQAATKATPEERPSGVPDLRLERRPAAQRRKKDFKLDPVYVIPEPGPIKGGFTYTVFTGSRGAIFGVTPLVEGGRPSLSTGIVPGHQESFLQARINRVNGVNLVEVESLPGANANYTPYTDSPLDVTNTRIEGDGAKFYSRENIADIQINDPLGLNSFFEDFAASDYSDIYGDRLVASFIVDDVLNLIFYRSFQDTYDVVYTTAYDTNIGGVPVTRRIKFRFTVRARVTTDCFVVTLNLSTGASTKSNFMFHEYKHTQTLKCVPFVRPLAGTQYQFWNAYTENIFTTELLTFLSESTHIPNFDFTTLPLFVGTTQENYTHTHTDNVAEITPAAGVTHFRNPLIRSVLNPNYNNLIYGQSHTLISFLPYANPLYAIAPGVGDTYGFINYPRWEGYDSKTSTRVISAGPFASIDGSRVFFYFSLGVYNIRRDLLEISKTTKPANVQDLKRIGHPWPQSFNTYNDGLVLPLDQSDILILDSFSAQTRSAILSSQALPYVGVAKDETAPNMQPLDQKYVVNGPWFELGSSRAIPISNLAFYATLRRVMYRIVYQ